VRIRRDRDERHGNQDALGHGRSAAAIARQSGWTHRFSAKLTCVVIGIVGGAGDVDCTYGEHSFRISPTLVRIKN
jgi:hypothetical protein